jgi:hypothetical protein
MRLFWTKVKAVAGTVLAATLVSAFFVLPIAAYAAENIHDGSLGDTNLRFIGRWDKHDPKVFQGNWTGHYIRTIFTGTTVKVQVAADVNMLVSIDDKPFQRFDGKAGVVNLTPTPLAQGKHTFLLTPRREEDEIQFQGLQLDPGATTLPIPELPIIEFTGDSITTNAGDQNDYKDFVAIHPYSWKVSEFLGVDHAQISQSGIPLLAGNGRAPGKGMEVQYFKTRNPLHNESELWTPSCVPVIVVFNLGTCDDVKDADFAATYQRFLRKARTANPNADFVVMRTFCGKYADCTRQAVETLVKEGDQHLYYVDTTGWLTRSDFVKDGVHPSIAGSLKAAQRLLETLKPLLAKKTPKK